MSSPRLSLRSWNEKRDRSRRKRKREREEERKMSFNVVMTLRDRLFAAFSTKDEVQGYWTYT